MLSRINVLYAANNIKDYSIDPNYCTMFGYTYSEIVHNFNEYIIDTAKTMRFDTKELLEKIRIYYDGYTFCGETTVYSPISILNFFAEKCFKAFWVETDNQEFIEKYISSNNIDVEGFDKSEVEIDESEIESPGEITKELEPALYLYQAGYLTPKLNPATNTYCLTYPNMEVRFAILKLTKYNFFDSKEERSVATNEFRKFTVNGDYVGILTTFNRIFSGERAMLFENLEAHGESALEVIYKMILHVYLETEKFKTTVEPQNNLGRADLILKLYNKTIAFEIKVSQTETNTA
jgi:hypothetical protein